MLNSRLPVCQMVQKRLNVTEVPSETQMPLLRTIRNFSSWKIKAQTSLLRRRRKELIMFHPSMKKPTSQITENPKKAMTVKENHRWKILPLGHLIQNRVPGKILLQVTFWNWVILFFCSYKGA